MIQISGRQGKKIHGLKIMTSNFRGMKNRKIV